MKKDKKWLKEQIERLSYTPKGLDENSSIISKNWVLNFIEQLDEPEALSQQWIDENKVERINNLRKMTTSDVVTVEKLENLLVPKQEITFEQAHDKLREESILSEKSFDCYWNFINDNVEIDEPGSILVPKQDEPEKTVIPQFVSDWIEDYRDHGGVIVDMLGSLTTELDSLSSVDNEVAQWFRENTEKMLKALMDGYEVEKEKVYQVIFPDGSSLVSEAIDDFDNKNTFIGKPGDMGIHSFTEKTIKSLDTRYLAFAEEVME